MIDYYFSSEDVSKRGGSKSADITSAAQEVPPLNSNINSFPKSSKLICNNSPNHCLYKRHVNNLLINDLFFVQTYARPFFSPDPLPLFTCNILFLLNFWSPQKIFRHPFINISRCWHSISVYMCIYS